MACGTDRALQEISTTRFVLSFLAVDLPSAITQGAPTVSEQMRPVALTPPPQQASPPVKPSGAVLLLQPLPAQDPQLSAQQTLLA